jgi:hypothetical protein
VRAPEIRAPGAINLGPAFYVVIGALVVGLAFALVLAIRNASSAAKKKARRAAGRGILEEDEPDRTLDEWLALANKLESQGRFREVVRCLYVAILLRLDGARLVRFERSETNWEHLFRIESTANLPLIEYRSLTKSFDLIWYGDLPASSTDCAFFREQYVALTRQLEESSK